MSPTPVVSVVLGTYNRRPFLQAAIESVRRETASLEHETIVIDGGSTDGSIRWLTRQRDIVTIIQHNRGDWRGRPLPRRSWGYFMNLGFRSARAEFILMISDDCLLVPGGLQRGLERFQSLLAHGVPIGALAFYWRNWPEQEDYRVGRTLGGKLFVNHGLYLRRALEDVGWIDEERYQFYHADGDLCLKLWDKGYEVRDSPASFVEHFSRANLEVRASNLERQKKDWENYLERWSGIFFDPAHPLEGSWVRQRYDDPDRTASRFPRIRRGRGAPRRLVRQASRWGRAVGRTLAARRGKVEPRSGTAERKNAADAARPRPVAAESELRLHLGCGETRLDGYVNIDFPSEKHTVQQRSVADAHADIRELNYPPESVREIRLHHVFEHFDRATALELLVAWRSWLKPNGKLVIETPDFDRSVRAWFESRDWASRFKILRHLFGSHESGWAIHYDGWDAEKFSFVLSRLGFTDICAERTQWRGTYNVTVTARKDASLRTEADNQEAVRRLLSLSLVDDSEGERRLLEVWLRKREAIRRAAQRGGFFPRCACGGRETQ